MTVFDEVMRQRFKARLPAGFYPVSLLGQGGCATVLRARSRGFPYEVALKIAHKGSEVWVKNERDRLVELRGVSGIVKMLQSGESPTAYLACEIVKGSTLETYFKQGSVTLKQALKLIARLADILADVHQRGVVHRDVKPENVLAKLGKRPSLALIDFGLGVRLGQKTSILDQVSGSLSFMAPEAFDTHKLPGFGQDLYALGILLYQACTGRLPFLGNSAMEVCVKHHNAPIPSLPPGYPARLNALVAVCLEKLPKKRLSDALTFARVLREGIEELGPLGNQLVRKGEPLVKTAFELTVR